MLNQNSFDSQGHIKGLLKEVGHVLTTWEWGDFALHTFNFFVFTE